MSQAWEFLDRDKRPIILATDEELAQHYRDDNRFALGPDWIKALSALKQVFGGTGATITTRRLGKWRV